MGIKSAVGEMGFWRELTAAMARTSRGVDFITIDGGEGGTGAAPLVFADHVALPFQPAIHRVYRGLRRARGSATTSSSSAPAKLGFPESALLAFALGCDIVNVAREAMMAIGCIQAQRCHTGHCPTGVATQSAWLARGVDPDLKSARAGRYLVNLRREILTLARACGVAHPALVTTEMFELFAGRFETASVQRLTGYEDGWGRPSSTDREVIVELMRGARTAG